MNTQISEKVPLITLVGPPNSGKTTLFNALSGKNYKTANYPGATVEYSYSKFHSKYKLNANLLDSPGIVSLQPNSPDEKISVGSLYRHPKLGSPDLVIVTVDSSQLSRHLLLVKQLLESGFNVIVALTMIDILNKRELNISSKKLSEELSCDVVKVDPRTGKGIENLLKTINTNLEVNSSVRELIKLNGNYDFNKILNSFKEIGVIENKVIHEISEKNIDDPQRLIEEANKRLKILNNAPLKRNNRQPDSSTLKIDKILLHKFWGLILFFLIMAFTFTSIFWFAAPIMDLVSNAFSILSNGALALLGNNWFGDFIANGIISGTGSVLVFVPQILILFLILGLLEDTGYLARGAMLIDKPLSKIGLNGKSFVPMLSGFACAIPAMMAARTIPNKRERLLTIFILPLLSCSARLPVYTLLIAFLIPPEKAWIGGLILASIYIFSTLSSIAVAAVINKFKNKIINESDSSSFILELPAYRKPKLSIVLKNSVTSAKLYLKKAGPAILVFSIVLWLLTYFPNYNPQVDVQNLSGDEAAQVISSERLATSYAADLGKIIQPVMTPVGLDWRVGVSLIAAFAAREVFVSSMALIFKVTNDDDDSIQASLLDAMKKAEIGNTGQKLFTPATIAGLIIFFVFALQCLSTVAVSRKETGSWRIPILQIVIFTSIAYTFMFIVVNGLRALGIA